MFGANTQRILVTGGGTFLGDAIAAALLAEGADVTLLVRPGTEDRLGVLAQRVHLRVADVWDTASLRGRGRGHGLAIHTVGSMIADSTQGLSYHRLNFVSARNVATMCVSDGVPHLMLVSSAAAPWINRQYIRSKREAEQYLGRVGVRGTVIRAPLAYVRGKPRPMFFELMTLLGRVPPFSVVLRRVAPMPVDVLARGVARLALASQRTKTVFYAPDLRGLNSRQERKGAIPLAIAPVMSSPMEDQPHPFELLDEDTPFGWAPPQEPRSR